jgi:hypothetical protein
LIIRVSAAHSRHSAAAQRGGREVGAVLISRITLAGLAVMGATALCSAIWPAMAAVVADVFVSLLVTVMTVPAALGVRRVHSELAGRRELRTMRAVATAADAAAPVVPTLAELRDSA